MCTYRELAGGVDVTEIPQFINNMCELRTRLHSGLCVCVCMCVRVCVCVCDVCVRACMHTCVCTCEVHYYVPYNGKFSKVNYIDWKVPKICSKGNFHR